MSWKPTLPPFRKFKKEVFIKAGMVSDFIYQIGEYPQLRKPSTAVPLEKIQSAETQAKIAYLKACLLRYRELIGYGRAITAVQVGIPEKFAVVYREDGLLVLINPKITKISEKQYRYPEICMSGNPIIAPVVRPAWIEFSYYDEQGKEQYWDTKDETSYGKMMNRVLQHEIDHMDGVITIDLVTSPKELFLESDPAFYDSAKFEKV